MSDYLTYLSYHSLLKAIKIMHQTIKQFLRSIGDHFKPAHYIVLVTLAPSDIGPDRFNRLLELPRGRTLFRMALHEGA